jgi:RNA polymerase sigma factor (TIGR02999 family)
MTRVSERTTTPTDLLLAWGRGETAALDQLVPLVHDELRRMARRYMGRERPDHTLQATALVNEVYLRLIEVDQVRGQNRAQFFALTAQVMRRILVDFARARGSDKRGGDAQKVSLDEVLMVSRRPSQDLVALDEALQALAQVDPRKSQTVELRFFGGLTIEETAEVLRVSPDTVKRDWRFAKLWLLRELTGRARA